MKEFIRRLAVNPPVFFLLVFSSLLANLLALAVPLFVIQILGRFMSVGLTSTLAALAVGTLLAVLFEFILRNIRFHLAKSHMVVLDHNLITGLGRLLSEADPAEIDQLLNSNKQGVGRPSPPHPLEAINRVLSAYTPQNLCGFLDLPFAFLFIVIIFFIDSTLGMICAACAGSLWLILLALNRFGALARQNQQQVTTMLDRSLRNSVFSLGSLRYFISGERLHKRWVTYSQSLIDQLHHHARRASSQQNIILAVQAIQTILIISVGALLSLDGVLEISALIGVNILAARAIQPISRFSTIAEATHNAEPAALQLEAIIQRLGGSSKQKSPLMDVFEQIEIVGLSAKAEEAASPSFNPLNATLSAGSLILLRCQDDQQLRHFREAITGMRQAAQGGVSLNGVNIRQLPFDWMRLQFGILPTNPAFDEGTLESNFMAIQEKEEAEIIESLRKASIDRLIQSHPKGLSMPLLAIGDQFTPENKWRLGLARLAYVTSPILFIEDPIENLEPAKYQSFLKWVAHTTAAGHLVIFASKRATALNGATAQITLGRHNQPSNFEALGGKKAATPISFIKHDTRYQNEDDKQSLMAQMKKTRLLSIGLSCVISVMVTMVGIWSYFGEVDRLSFSSAVVVPIQQVQTVETLDGGIVKEIFVAEGDQVTQNAPIIELEGVMDASSLAELDIRLLTLDLARQRLEARLNRAQALNLSMPSDESLKPLYDASLNRFASWRNRYDSDIAMFGQIVDQRNDEINALNNKITALEKEITIVTEQKTISGDLLNRGIGNRMEHLSIERNRTALERELGQAVSALATARSALAQAKSNLQSQKAADLQEANQELETVLRDYNELQNRRERLLDTQKRRVLRASIDGEVKSITTFTVGAVIPPNGLVAEIVPAGDYLQIESRLPVTEIGFIETGMTANIRLASQDAFRFAPIEAVVDKISPDSFTDEQGRAFYKMILTVKARAFKGNRPEEIFRIVPGLNVSVAVVIGKRTVFDYLSEPIARGLGTVFRER